MCSKARPGNPQITQPAPKTVALTVGGEQQAIHLLDQVASRLVREHPERVKEREDRLAAEFAASRQTPDGLLMDAAMYR